MEEAGVSLNQPLVTYYESAELTQPSEGALNYPPPPVPTQLAPILISGSLIATSGWDDWLDTTPFECLAKWVGVITPIRYEPLRALARSPRSVSAPHCYSPECVPQQLHPRWGCRVQVRSQRSARAINQNHPLRALAAFGFADSRAPFLAGAKLPSAKHSSQRTLSRSLSCAKKARHISSSAPLCSHSRSLRQQVEGLPYCLGSSPHCAPVHRTHKIPSKQRRSSARGLPPLGLGLYRGRCGPISSHCSSVNPLHAILTHNHSCSPLARRF
jgi:hypothetical protein